MIHILDRDPILSEMFIVLNSLEEVLLSVF